jgi:hypothetical protein
MHGAGNIVLYIQFTLAVTVFDKLYSIGTFTFLHSTCQNCQKQSAKSLDFGRWERKNS